MNKIKAAYEFFAPLVADYNHKGNLKSSVGRFLAVCAGLAVIYRYTLFGMDPGTGILTFFGTCMAYMGYTKKVAQPTGAAAPTDPTKVLQEGQDG